MELTLTADQVRETTRSLFLATMAACDSIGEGRSALDEYRDCIVRYLDQCGGNAEEVANWCDDRGIRGECGNPLKCVIAELIRYAFGADAIVGDTHFTIGYGDLHAEGKLPHPVRTFVTLFDTRQYDYLCATKGGE